MFGCGNGYSRRSEELLQHDVHPSHHLGEEEVVARLIQHALFALIPSFGRRYTKARGRGALGGGSCSGGSREGGGGHAGVEEAARGLRAGQRCGKSWRCHIQRLVGGVEERRGEKVVWQCVQASLSKVDGRLSSEANGAVSRGQSVASRSSGRLRPCGSARRSLPHCLSPRFHSLIECSSRNITSTTTTALHISTSPRPCSAQHSPAPHEASRRLARAHSSLSSGEQLPAPSCSREYPSPPSVCLRSGAMLRRPGWDKRR